MFSHTSVIWANFYVDYILLNHETFRSSYTKSYNVMLFFHQIAGAFCKLYCLVLFRIINEIFTHVLYPPPLHIRKFANLSLKFLEILQSKDGKFSNSRKIFSNLWGLQATSNLYFLSFLMNFFWECVPQSMFIFQRETPYIYVLVIAT